jgi:hypothetical protein
MPKNNGVCGSYNGDLNCRSLVFCVFYLAPEGLSIMLHIDLDGSRVTLFLHRGVQLYGQGIPKSIRSYESSCPRFRKLQRKPSYFTATYPLPLRGSGGTDSLEMHSLIAKNAPTGQEEKNWEMKATWMGHSHNCLAVRPRRPTVSKGDDVRRNAGCLK